MMEQIKTLRERTHLGMTECKNALTEANGDLDKAIEILQKKGLKKVDDLLIPLEGEVKAGVIYNEGKVSFGTIAEINCQTDFGAKSEPFQVFINNYLGQEFLTDDTIKQLEFLAKQLGEKVVARRRMLLKSTKENAVFTAYNHPGGRLAVLIEAYVTENKDKAQVALDNLAMHVAATKPLYLIRQNVPEELVNKKKLEFAETIKNKPDNIKEKIIDGKLNKWYGEFVCLDQAPIFAEEKAAKETLQAYLDREIGKDKYQVAKIIRFERGEDEKGVGISL